MLSHKADELAKEELKIIRWLQFMRSTNLAMKRLFSASEWLDIQNDAKFMTVSIDNQTNTVVCLEEVDDLVKEFKEVGAKEEEPVNPKK